MGKYTPKVGAIRWRQLITQNQQRNRTLLEDLQLLKDAAENTETENHIMQLMLLAHENLANLSDMLQMDGTHLEVDDGADRDLPV